MKKALLLLMVLSNNLYADFHSWNSDQYCYHFSDAGVAKKKVEDNYCGWDFNTWNSEGQCFERAGSGRWKRIVPASYLRLRSLVGFRKHDSRRQKFFFAHYLFFHYLLENQVLIFASAGRSKN